MVRHDEKIILVSLADLADVGRDRPAHSTCYSGFTKHVVTLYPHPGDMKDRHETQPVPSHWIGQTLELGSFTQLSCE